MRQSSLHWSCSQSVITRGYHCNECEIGEIVLSIYVPLLRGSAMHFGRSAVAILMLTYGSEGRIPCPYTITHFSITQSLLVFSIIALVVILAGDEVLEIT